MQVKSLPTTPRQYSRALNWDPAGFSRSHLLTCPPICILSYPLPRPICTPVSTSVIFALLAAPLCDVTCDVLGWVLPFPSFWHLTMFPLPLELRNFFKICVSLKCSWFIILHWFHMCSKVIQLHVCMHSFKILSSIMFYHRMFIIDLCGIQWNLVVYLFSVCNSLHLLTPAPNPFRPWSHLHLAPDWNHKSGLCVCESVSAS